MYSVTHVHIHINIHMHHIPIDSYTEMFIAANNKKRPLISKRARKGMWEGLDGEREGKNDVIILQS